MTPTDLMARRARLLGPNVPTFYDDPVHVVRGEGVWLWDAAGRRYLDCYNNVPHVGHCHPRVVEAIARQAARLNIHTRYLNDLIVDYAERLTATFDDPLDAVMFTCSGTESNELALRLARFLTGGQGVIVSDFTYHGNSETLAALTSCFPTPEPFPPYARAIPIPDPARDKRPLSELADIYAG